jgi:hypothetical protein
LHKYPRTTKLITTYNPFWPSVFILLWKTWKTEADYDSAEELNIPSCTRIKDENDCRTAYPTIKIENIPEPDPIIQIMNIFIKMDLPGARASSHDC